MDTRPAQGGAGPWIAGSSNLIKIGPYPTGYASGPGAQETLAKDFKGPADFCVMGSTAYVPDLVKSEVRIIRMDR